MGIYKRIINKFLRRYEINMIPTRGKVVYLTFDDGPEDGITEFVLDELAKYGFKATFFCRGDNAEKHPELMKMLRDRGHSIGNHTYSHLHSYDTSAKMYSEDVEKANKILHTNLFRPPHGSLTFSAWMKLHKKYRIFFWSINSGDSDMEGFSYLHSIDNLKNSTSCGDIMLFHFCHRHEKETMQLLPVYLKWLHESGYKCEVIRVKY